MKVMKLLLRKNGFSLIEIVIVITIVGVIASVAYPSFRVLRRDNILYSEAKCIAADIKYMQQLAMDQREIYSMIFSEIDQNYIIEVGIERVKNIQLENGVFYDSIDPDGNIAIGPDGLLIGDSKKIILKSADNMYIYIFVEDGGRVRVSWENV